MEDDTAAERIDGQENHKEATRREIQTEEMKNSKECDVRMIE